MITEEWISSAQTDRWKAALDGVAHSYWHRPGPCHAAALNTGCPVFLVVLRAAEARLVCPVMLRTWGDSLDVATPIGFSGLATTRSGEEAPLLQRWPDVLAARGANSVYLAQHPLFGPDIGMPGDSLGSTLYVIDLSLSLEDWLSRIDENRRRAIRAWQRDGSPWVRDRARLVAFLVEHHAPAMRALNASRASYYSAEALTHLCADEDVELVGAEDETGLCSVAVFGASPWGAELVFHISIGNGKRFSTALMWWAVQYFRGRVPLLNLGGTPAEDDALAQAKRRYKPDEVRYHRIRRVLDAGTYARLCREAGRSPDGAGYFPAYRTPGPAAVDDGTSNNQH